MRICIEYEDYTMRWMNRQIQMKISTDIHSFLHMYDTMELDEIEEIDEQFSTSILDTKYEKVEISEVL